MVRFPYTRIYQRFLFHCPLVVGGESCVCEGTLRNLSMHGCSIVCDREFPIGRQVRVHYFSDDTSPNAWDMACNPQDCRPILRLELM